MAQKKSAKESVLESLLDHLMCLPDDEKSSEEMGEEKPEKAKIELISIDGEPEGEPDEEEEDEENKRYRV